MIYNFRMRTPNRMDLKISHYIICWILILQVLGLHKLDYVFANNIDEEQVSTKAVQEEIQRIGTGKDAKAEITLHNTKLKGYIREIKSDRFVLVYNRSGNYAEIFFSQVIQVKSKRISTGRKIALGAGITSAALAITWLLLATSD